MSEYQRLHRQIVAERKQGQRAGIEAKGAVLAALEMLEHFDPELWGAGDVSRIERARQALRQLLDQHVL